VRYFIPGFLALSTAFAFTPPASAQLKAPGGAKVLLLSGGQRNHHGYRRQTYLLQRLLEETKQFETTICEDAAILETPGLEKFDAIVAMADRRDSEFRLSQSQQQALLKFVREGKGFFSFHAFCCADSDWLPEMRVLLGGVLAHFGMPNTKVRSGKYLFKINDSEHAITRGFADFQHVDELYYDLQIQGDLRPLATALYQDKEWPVLWTRTYGKGRTCVSVFGHCGFKPDAPDPLEHEPFQRLILRCVAWSAGRELKER
jgi:type 1 glutamine amidotransferase